MGNILIIDDEPEIRAVLKDVLNDENYQVYLAGDGMEGLAILEHEAVDLVILDVWLPNMGGIDVLKLIKEKHPDIEVIIISGHANINIAVKAVKMGAFDFLEKPLSLDKIITVVGNAIRMETLRKENKDLRETLQIEDELVGTSPEMMRIRELIRQSAESDARILITGENGTGKELVAREIHRRSLRAAGPFVALNCAAIPDTLIETELFGHEKGSFTDAVTTRKGKFEIANKGTLFLDEIGDMSLNTQAKMLRVIQELRFERVGSEKSMTVDVRVIAATNKNLEEEIKNSKFREDLFFRLNVIPIHVEPLRERQEDIVALIEYFMKKYKKQSAHKPKTLSTKALDELKKYHWPGNIRELKNFIERINIMTDEEVISAETVATFLGKRGIPEDNGEMSLFDNMKLNEAKDSFERELIQKKLKETGQNISKAAEELGITPSNLHGKLKKYGIRIER
jgi:two-component system, NtrC family, nitrogen regulation response regulator NtrX